MMQPVFPRINTAIRSTLEYYEIGRIRDTIARISKVERISSTPHNLDLWLELLYGSHKDMEDEIQQTIFTSTQNMHVELFDYLKDWVLDWRMQGINIDYINQEIEKVNAKSYDNFVVKIEGEVIKFQQTPNFINLEHLEVIKQPETSDSAFNKFLLNLTDSPFPKKYNHKYYCIKETLPFIDPSYIAEYARITNPIFDNFRSILIKYLTRYKEGKIIPNAQVVIEKLTLPSSNETLELPAPESDPIQKLKWTGTAQEFVDFFAPLINDRKIILKHVNKGDTNPIAKYLHSLFEIQKDKGKGEIALSSLQTYFKKFNTNLG